MCTPRTRLSWWSSRFIGTLSRKTGARNRCWRKASVWKRRLAEIWLTRLRSIKSRLPVTCPVGVPAHHQTHTASNWSGFVQSCIQRNIRNNIREPNTTVILHKSYMFRSRYQTEWTKWRQSYFIIPAVHRPIFEDFINLLNPTGHVMHQQFNIQELYVLPTLYLCVLYLSENKQRLVPLTA